MIQMELQKRFESFIKEKTLFNKKDTILLAVSGGLDSVAMAELFHRSKYKFVIAHCNFQLRGKDSDGDELFVKQLAKKYQVPFHTIRFDTKAFSKKNKLSIQEGARKLRYDWFRRVLKEEKYSCLATAHHYNDSAETFFINLLRGTGINGLTGIKPISDDLLYTRPLLFATRNELEEFASKEKLKFRHDKSNDSDYYLRNRVRHHLIPLFEQLNPDFEKVMKRNLNNMLFAQEVFESSLLKKLNTLWLGKPGTELDRKEMELEEYPSDLFSEFTRKFGFNSTQAEDIWNSKKNGSRVFSEQYVLTANRTKIILSKIEEKPFDETLILKTQKQFNQSPVALKLKLVNQSLSKKFPLPKNQYTHCLSSDQLNFPLTLRKWQAGDSFQPLGMKGKKKISDFLIDRKVSLPDKEKTYVLLSGENIVCVLGHRIDERYKVTEKTKKIYQIEYISK